MVYNDHMIVIFLKVHFGSCTFILYINDIFMSVKSSQTVPLADDTSVYSSGKFLINIVENFEEDLLEHMDLCYSNITQRERERAI